MHYDMMVCARKALADGFGDRYKIAYENIKFTPPDDGGMWLKFNYMESATNRNSLDRKCTSFLGLVQIGIIVPPSLGLDNARLLAKEIADYFPDGKMFNANIYIYSGGEVRPAQKSETGWLLPIRFTVRSEKRV